jgi:hypothetical protein
MRPICVLASARRERRHSGLLGTRRGTTQDRGKDFGEATVRGDIAAQGRIACAVDDPQFWSLKQRLR